MSLRELSRSLVGLCILLALHSPAIHASPPGLPLPTNVMCDKDERPTVPPPSPRYLEHPPQFIPTDPDFPLTNELAEQSRVPPSSTEDQLRDLREKLAETEEFNRELLKDYIQANPGEVERELRHVADSAIDAVVLQVYWLLQPFVGGPRYVYDPKEGYEQQIILPESLLEQCRRVEVEVGFDVAIGREDESTGPTRPEPPKLALPEFKRTPYVSLSLDDMSFQAVIETLNSMYGVNIQFDRHEVEAAGVDLQKPLTVSMRAVPFTSALENILYPMNLAFDIRSDYVQIVAQPPGFKELMAKRLLEERLTFFEWNDTTVRTAFLIEALDPQDKRIRTLAQSARVIQRIGHAASKTKDEANAAEEEMTYKLYKVQDLVAPDLKQGQAGRVAELIDWITQRIDPASWEQCGGPATMDFYPLSKRLIIKQRPKVHDDIAKALAEVRDKD
jgi:hypothetical protein